MDNQDFTVPLNQMWNLAEDNERLNAKIIKWLNESSVLSIEIVINWVKEIN